MLSLYLRNGESLLAENLFLLRWLEFRGELAVCELETLERVPYLVTSPRGCVSGGLVYPTEPALVEIGQFHWLAIHDCRLTLRRERSTSVNVSIDAPPSVRITRPAQHGTSLRSA